ncbi:hypothetical protein GPECTOR_11g325 [Gonium pectorale]|uniref:Uncharacterized protein n=1 Tax=Gonium pectorale TaxID=33097 RepID=A0A150GQ04_GONPE|nr:hypothetical protein GPECTOR_11g325 [Gonium pectorale]|eukprot:KXZ51891.1 hypothetical protein GPECTOR_11g325 [Gonium pectorale]
MSSSLRLPDRAVHVFFLRELAKEKVPGKTSGYLGDLKTFQVVREYVQPATSKFKTNFIDCLVGGQLGKYEPEWCHGGTLSQLPGTPRAVGPTSYFVSHAWSYTFSGLVSLVERHYEGLADTERGKKFVPVYYWVDILAVTQHFAGDFKDHPDSDFPGVIRASKAVLFTMYPWRSPIAPTRVWCLFEALTAVQSEAQHAIQIATPAPPCAHFVPPTSPACLGPLQEALMTTTLKKATAARDSDALIHLLRAGAGRDEDDTLDVPRWIPYGSADHVVNLLDGLSGSAVPRRLLLAGREAGQDERVNIMTASKNSYSAPVFAYMPLPGKILAAVARLLKRLENPAAAAGSGGARRGGIDSVSAASGRRAGVGAGAGPGAGAGVGRAAVVNGGSRMGAGSGAPSRAGSKGPVPTDALGGGDNVLGVGGAAPSRGCGGGGGGGVQELWLRPAQPYDHRVSYRPFWASSGFVSPEEAQLAGAVDPAWDRKEKELRKTHPDFRENWNHYFKQHHDEWKAKQLAKVQAAAEAQAAKERPAKEAAERADRALLWPSLGSCSSLALLGLYNGWMTADDVEGLGRALRSSRTVRELHLVAVRPEDGYPGGLAGLTRELLAAALGSRSLEVLVLAPPQVAFLEGLEVPAAAAWDLGGGAAIKDFTLAPVALGPRAAKQLAELLAPLPQLEDGVVDVRRPKPRCVLPGDDAPLPGGYRIAEREREVGLLPRGTINATPLAPVLQVLETSRGGSSSGPARAAALTHFIAAVAGPVAVTTFAKSAGFDPAVLQKHQAALQDLLKLALEAAAPEYASKWEDLLPFQLVLELLPPEDKNRIMLRKWELGQLVQAWRDE